MKCDRWQRGLPCPYCTEGVKGRRFYPGHRGNPPRPAQCEGITQMIKRQSASASDVRPGDPAARDVAMEADNPLLFEYLTSTTFGDGSERETSTLLLFASGGVWKGCLNDRAEGQALWVSGASVGDVLEALERALDTTSPDWRRTQTKSKKNGR